MATVVSRAISESEISTFGMETMILGARSPRRLLSERAVAFQTGACEPPQWIDHCFMSDELKTLDGIDIQPPRRRWKQPQGRQTNSRSGEWPDGRR
jgi:hypothetical protein